MSTSEAASNEAFNTRWNRVAVLMNMGRSEQAVFEAMSLCTDHPHVAAAHQILAFCFCRSGDIRAARHEAFEALRLDPDDVQTLKLCSELAGTTKESLALQRRAVELDPGDPYSLVNLAVYERLSGTRRKKWRPYVSAALAMAPEDPDILVTAAELEGGKATRTGTRLLREALLVDPHHERAIAVLTEGAATTRDFREVTRALVAALAVDPTNRRLLSAGHLPVRRIHSSLVLFTIIAEVFCCMMAPSVSYDPMINGGAAIGCIWAMMYCTIIICAIPAILGMGGRMRSFFASFYGEYPVKRATALASVILGPAQVVVVLVTGDLNVAGIFAGISLAVTAAVYVLAKISVSRRNRVGG